MNDLNSFFDSATPAQINQLTAQPPKQTQPEHQVQPIHPKIQQAIPTVDELPEVEMSAEPHVLVAPEIESPSHQEQPVPIPQAQAEEPLETPQLRRFREMREARLRAEWERDDMARRLREYEEAKSRPQVQAESEDDFGIDPDAVLEGKDIVKVLKRHEKQIERKIAQQYQQQQQVVMQNVVENRLKMEMPDIDNVVNAENIRQLQSMYPELAQSINSNPDLYTKAKAAYTMIKKLNIVPEPQPVYDYEADRRRIAQNTAKPKPVQTVAQRQSPLAASNAYDGELTDAIKNQYWKEMQKAMKG